MKQLNKAKAEFLSFQSETRSKDARRISDSSIIELEMTNKFMRVNFCSVLIILLSFFLLYSSLAVAADENPLNQMRDSAVSYFTPMKGNIISVSGAVITADIGSNSKVKKGMRFSIFREGPSFLHPVTREPIGLVETFIGKAEVTGVSPDKATLNVLSGSVKESDKLRISQTGVRALFFQSESVEWNLGDAYFRALKDSGRFELIDTELQTEKDADILAEARKKGANIALILSAQNKDNDVILKQRLFWIDGSQMFADEDTKVSQAFVTELKTSFEMLGLKKDEVARIVEVPFSARFIAAGDIDGDGSPELIVSTGKDIRVFTPQGDISTQYQIIGSMRDDHIWFDVVDINKDNRAEIIVTLIKGDAVISRIYELKDNAFVLLWESRVFVRVFDNELLAQEYEPGEGYKGPVYKLDLKNGYKKGENLKLPPDVNIYDFAYIKDQDNKKLILAYDDRAFLNLYDENGIRLWKSKSDYGGFLTQFKKETHGLMVDSGSWSVKDRFVMQGRQVFAIKRLPLVGMARGFGFSRSQIKKLFWTGVSVEEETIIENVPSNALDYTFADDKIMVLTKPSIGFNIKNIYKGEGIAGSVIYIYSLKRK